MTGLEEILSKRWIVKAEEKEKYYMVRDNLEEIRKYVTEKLGCQLIVNSHMIKLEKIPPTAEPYMGITSFSDKREYCFLCLILMFLEDKEPQEQFVLSKLTEYLSTYMVGERIDWTVYSLRKQLIRVIRFCVENNILRITDGEEDSFSQNQTAEVLYENTGISKFFMKMFTRDIMRYNSTEDFEKSDWVDVNEDRGIARRHRIYKKLLFSPGMYRQSTEDEDFDYLKNYGNRLAEDFEKNLKCRLQIHKNSAFLIMNEDCKLGNEFPANNSLSDMVLLCNHFFSEKIRGNEYPTEWNECVILDVVEFEKQILECRNRYGAGLVKTYRDKTSSEFIKVITDYMEQIGFIQIIPDRQQIQIYPVIGKITGYYPNNFNAGEKENT